MHKFDLRRSPEFSFGFVLTCMDIKAASKDSDTQWAATSCLLLASSPQDKHNETKSNNIWPNDLQNGDLDSRVFALCKTIVIVPVLSWIEQSDGQETKYFGSLGQLVGLEPKKKDRIDSFLVQIVVANALFGLPSQYKAIKSIYPIFSDLVILNTSASVSSPRGHILQLLSTDPSILSNQKAAELLNRNDFPVSSGMLQRSVRENVARLFDLYWDDDRMHRQVLPILC